MSEREYPDLLSDEEKKELLKLAEGLWVDLQENKLGGFSGVNRPFHILNCMKYVIEKYGRRDIGETWSKDELAAAKKRKDEAEGKPR